jgi:hypothetical protein
MAKRKYSSGLILLGIIGLVVLSVLIAPAEDDKGGSYSTLSAGSNGARLIYDLSDSLGWKPQRRDVEFVDDRRPAPVQVLINAPIGDGEAHALLDFVRRGGGLLIAGLQGPLSDSLPVTEGRPAFPSGNNVQGCGAVDPFETVLQVPHAMSAIVWRRPAPPDTVGFGDVQAEERGVAVRPAVGFPLGAGRVVAVASPAFLANDVVRVCANDADVAFVRMVEYLTNGTRGVPIEFDEFHHGSGVHGGSISAVERYVATTPSGRLLGQVALAGLLLLLAVAPRPLAPRDPQRIARRSPLEHADALAHAYSAVGASKTATQRLVAGVRRRVRGGRAGRETDEQLLTAAAAMSGDAGGAVQTVSHALTTTIPERELPAVAAAVSRVELALSRPHDRTR